MAETDSSAYFIETKTGRVTLVHDLLVFRSHEGALVQRCNCYVTAALIDLGLKLLQTRTYCKSLPVKGAEITVYAGQICDEFDIPQTQLCISLLDKHGRVVNYWFAEHVFERLFEFYKENLGERAALIAMDASVA